MFVNLPGTSADSLKNLISTLKESGADVSQFFNRKITHLITSNKSTEMQKKYAIASKKLLTDPSSRGAMILARTLKKRSNVGIVERAKNLGVNVVFLEEMNLAPSARKKKPLEHMSVNDSCLFKSKRTTSKVDSVTLVRELKPPFIKVVDRSGCYRPLVAEMKEWPDAFTMFSQGPNVLAETKLNRDRKITFCELCEDHINDLENHLNSAKHIKNATDSKKWERVDALISKMPTIREFIESELKQLDKK